MKTSSFLMSNRDHSSVDGGHHRDKKPGDSTIKSDKKSESSTSTGSGRARQR